MQGMATGYRLYLVIANFDDLVLVVTSHMHLGTKFEALVCRAALHLYHTLETRNSN